MLGLPFALPAHTPLREGSSRWRQETWVPLLLYPRIFPNKDKSVQMKACLKGLFPPLMPSFIYYSFTEVRFEFHKIQRQISLGVMKYSEPDVIAVAQISTFAENHWMTNLKPIMWVTKDSEHGLLPKRATERRCVFYSFSLLRYKLGSRCFLQTLIISVQLPQNCWDSKLNKSASACRNVQWN